MNDSNNKCKCKCIKRCQIFSENSFECFPKYEETQKLPMLIQCLFTSNSGDQKNIDLLEYEIKPCNSFKTDSTEEVSMPNEKHENTNNGNILRK